MPTARQWVRSTSEGVFLVRYCGVCDGIYESIPQSPTPTGGTAA